MPMPTILEKIVAAKRVELAQRQAAVPVTALREQIMKRPKGISLAAALRGSGVQLIAEVKKASPSRGVLRADFDPVWLAQTYAANGAAAISVLTDAHFQGELAHISQIKAAKASGGLPVLRKDFIFDPYQVYEARAAGADAFLLIVAMLSPLQLQELIAQGITLGLEPLVETHDEAEIQTALDAGAEVIGVNNRDLHTFVTDLAVTRRLAPLVPPDRVLVSESGVSEPEHLRELAALGVKAALVGEALVTAPDVAAKVRQLSGQPVAPVGA